MAEHWSILMILTLTTSALLTGFISPATACIGFPMIGGWGIPGAGSLSGSGLANSGAASQFATGPAAVGSSAAAAGAASQASGFGIMGSIVASLISAFTGAGPGAATSAGTVAKEAGPGASAVPATGTGLQSIAESKPSVVSKESEGGESGDKSGDKSEAASVPSGGAGAKPDTKSAAGTVTVKKAEEETDDGAHSDETKHVGLDSSEEEEFSGPAASVAGNMKEIVGKGMETFENFGFGK